MGFELYDTDRLLCVEDTEPHQYWVLTIKGPSPLPIIHRVRKKHVGLAKSIFKDHPQGIEHIRLEELHYKKGLAWDPNED